MKSQAAFALQKLVTKNVAKIRSSKFVVGNWKRNKTHLRDLNLEKEVRASCSIPFPISGLTNNPSRLPTALVPPFLSLPENGKKMNKGQIFTWGEKAVEWVNTRGID